VEAAPGIEPVPPFVNSLDNGETWEQRAEAHKWFLRNASERENYRLWMTRFGMVVYTQFLWHFLRVAERHLWGES
jgi:hypothetical protein